MVTGYRSSVIAEARQRIEFINRSLVDFNGLLLQAQNAEQYNKDSSDLYLAARDLLMNTSDDLAIYNKFIYGKPPFNTEDTAQLEDLNFYVGESKKIDKIINAYEALLVQPGKSTESTADLSFDGVVTFIDDADTFWVGAGPDFDRDNDRRVRFAGIDAPELGTPEGMWSKLVIESICPVGTQVHIGVDHSTPYDLYGRWLGVPFMKWDPETNTGIDLCIELLVRCAVKSNTKFGKHHFVSADTNKNLAEACVWGWPLKGEYHISSKPAGAAVLVDGRDSGKNTPCDLMLDVGTHRLTLYAPGVSAVHDIIDVQNKKVKLPSYVLPKLPASTGLVHLVINPPIAKTVVSISGKIYGSAPLFVDLSVGTPTYATITAEGYENGSVLLNSVLGEIVKTTVELSPTGDAPAETQAPIPSRVPSFGELSLLAPAWPDHPTTPGWVQ